MKKMWFLRAIRVARPAVGRSGRIHPDGAYIFYIYSFAVVSGSYETAFLTSDGFGLILSDPGALRFILGEDRLLFAADFTADGGQNCASPESHGLPADHGAPESPFAASITTRHGATRTIWTYTN